MKTDLIILDKNARDVLKVLNKPKFPLVDLESVFNDDSLSLSNTNLISILDYLRSIEYIQESILEDNDSMVSPIILTYPAIYYEVILKKYKRDKYINNILLPGLISLVTSLVVVLISTWLQLLIK